MKQPTAVPRTVYIDHQQQYNQECGPKKKRTGSKISARIVCPATMKKVPVNPLMIRIAINICKLIDTAVPAEQAQSTRIAAL
jgi:hypothetical protein